MFVVLLSRSRRALPAALWSRLSGLNRRPVPYEQAYGFVVQVHVTQRDSLFFWRELAGTSDVVGGLFPRHCPAGAERPIHGRLLLTGGGAEVALGGGGFGVTQDVSDHGQSHPHPFELRSTETSQVVKRPATFEACTLRRSAEALVQASLAPGLAVLSQANRKRRRASVATSS